MKKLIKNALIFDWELFLENKKLDILIENGYISKIGINIDHTNIDKDKIIDLDEKFYVLPGFIDIHTHFREPGYEYKEDIESGSYAAIHGGYTTCIAMPNTNPPISNIEIASYVKNRSKWIDIIPALSITKDRKGEELNNLEVLFKEGYKIFTDDGEHVKNPYLMFQALRESGKYGFIIMEHSLDNNFFENGIINYGHYSKNFNFNGLPDVGETNVIFRDIELAILAGGNIHFTHVSTAKGVKLILEAKDKHKSITFDVTPNHLIFNEENIATKSGLFKVMPPLRDEENRSNLVKYMKDGKIDIIATDHAPHANNEKNIDIKMALPGLTGLETTFLALYNKFVLKEEIKIIDIIRMISFNPSRIFNIEKKGSLKVGNKADIVIFNPNEEVNIDKNFFFSKSLNSPFFGQKLRGKICKVFKDGEIIFDNGKIFRV
ncbi:MAG: dihydroorotase [Spirochaetes bacterium]|nr:dihydroorotase [Spirochaetota bacterium]